VERAPSLTAPSVTTPSAAHVDSTSAAQLFARANAARRSGEVGRALPLYRRLLTEFGASREARTAEVTMARLLLDTQGSATEALGLFQRYQREEPNGTLAEEAVLGEAEALKLLGRRAEEAAALARLVERFPTTVHRGRAEARLAEIAPPPP
jgi:TolA-binding protein